jgi:hypothetical protein
MFTIHDIELKIIAKNKIYKNHTWKELENVYSIDIEEVIDSYYLQEYKKNDKYHREGGPAYIEKFDGGYKSVLKWYINGKLHRLEGPAVIINDYDTFEMKEKFYIKGKCYEKEEFDNKLIKIKQKYMKVLFDNDIFSKSICNVITDYIL